MNQFPEFWRGYLSALMFTAYVDDDGCGDSLFDCSPGGRFEDDYPDPESTLVNFTDITARELAELYNDAIAFYLDEIHGQDYPDSIVFSAGSDFHFTRNGHGVGFWDRPDRYLDNTDRLTQASKAYGTLELTGRRTRNGRYEVYLHH